MVDGDQVEGISAVIGEHVFCLAVEGDGLVGCALVLTTKLAKRLVWMEGASRSASSRRPAQCGT